jgi:hypothetical protein
MRYFTLLFFCFCLVSYPCFSAKKQCQPYLDKLHTIQSQQRQGYNLKRGNNLAERETQARNKWWQCEQGKLEKKKKNKDKRKNTKKKASHTKKAMAVTTHHQSIIVPFQTSSAIVMKSRYQGEKLYAWLNYYQQPAECKKPKTTQAFAFCMENKLTQQEHFEQSYHLD